MKRFKDVLSARQTDRRTDGVSVYKEMVDACNVDADELDGLRLAQANTKIIMQFLYSLSDVSFCYLL